jgi:dynein heavy chain 2
MKLAVKGIKRNHLNEIKSFKTPPQAICDVLSGVLVLLGIQDLSWNSMKAFLAKRGIVDEILQLDIEKVSELRMKKVKSLSRKKKESFEKSTISRVSTAAAPLAAWVIANIKYMAIFETVKPMTTELKNLQIGLDDCKSTLVECEGTIRDTDHRLNELKSQFAIKTKETESLKHQFELARKRSGSAEILLEQLSGKLFVRYKLFSTFTH